MPDLTLYFLQASRSIRTAWLLEELGLDYTLKFSDRMPNQKAPDDFKLACGNPLGKFPTLKDGDLTVYESGAIAEYLCDKYDKPGRLLSSEDVGKRFKVLQWVHASEATFMIHALAITYARWMAPESVKESGGLAEMEKGMSVNVQKDLDWLETELSLGQTKFLCGNEVTAADTMMHFSVEYIIRMKIGTQGKSWPKVEKWLRACEETETYKAALKKTGHEIPAK